MKYLKRFNESVDFEERLKDFCETRLAYLLDEGFEVVLNDLDETYDCEITIKREDQRTFTWDEVKDHVVPFIIHLNKEYELYKSDDCSDDEYLPVKVGDIGYIQSELSSLYEPFSIEKISDESYEPFLRYKIAPDTYKKDRQIYFYDMGTRLSSIVIYAAIAN
jgi:hypothetical protein